ncbi:Hsp20/alpha crystallin family protein [Haloarcula marina]|uniref:Hsp20/alpha crystallin family protein n=1 Tax=Haloarcula marina TaxID=2961574 RepID=UPI0020B6779F|nr:Hsp20/alpha crystallin family protein [Halomicroarcula marina]
MDATTEQSELHVSQSEHEDGWTVAADLRPVDDDEVTVELVGATAIVAVDAPPLRTEFDLELPDADATASLNNGVLVVESDERD